MAEHPNVTLMKNVVDAINRNDMTSLNAFLAEDVVWHVIGRKENPGQYDGRDAALAFLGGLGDASAGTWHEDVLKVLADDEHAMLLGKETWETSEADVVQVIRVREGKVAEWWGIPRDQRSLEAVRG